MRDYYSLFWAYLGDVWWAVIVLKARTVTEEIDSSTTVTLLNLFVGPVSLQTSQ